jgi:hypothetical protein
MLACYDLAELVQRGLGVRSERGKKVVQVVRIALADRHRSIRRRALTEGVLGSTETQIWR